MIQELQSLGFTRNEANVYAAALRLGKCSVQQLAAATGLNRITVHSIVEKFEGMQLFLRTYEGKRRRVSPVDPQHLQMILAEEERSVQAKQAALQTMLPQMIDLFHQAQRGMEIRTFNGEKGYEEMCKDILTASTELLEYANIDQLNAVIGPYINAGYLPAKFARKIRSKFLYVDTPAARAYIDRNYLKNPKASPLEVKFIDPSFFKIDAFHVIYDGKVAIFTPQNLQGIIIRDTAISSALRAFFLFVWNRAGEATTNAA